MPAAKLARIAIMTLNHGSMLKLPWNANPNPNQTLALMDLPQYYIDTYGVRDVEFQHGHLAQDTSNPDAAFFKELKAKFDAVGSRANQINIEIGTMAQMGPDGKAAALAGEARANWLETAKKWVDVAPVLGIKRLMLNQGALTDDSKEGVISLWKELQDYARPKGIMISAETRGSGVPTAGGRGAARRRRPAAPPPPPAPDDAGAGAPALRVGHPQRVHRKVRRLLEPRLRRRGPLQEPAAASRRDQGHDEAFGGQHAHQVEPGLGHRQGHRVRRVDRIQGPLHDRSEPGSGDSHRLQHDSREHCIVRSSDRIICRRACALSPPRRPSVPRATGRGTLRLQSSPGEAVICVCSDRSHGNLRVPLARVWSCWPRGRSWTASS